MLENKEFGACGIENYDPLGMFSVAANEFMYAKPQRTILPEGVNFIDILQIKNITG